MKHVITLLITCLISFSLSAERADRFDNYESMTGTVIRLYNVISMVEHQGYFAYIMQDNRLKVTKDLDVYKKLETDALRVKGIIQNKKDHYLHIEATSEDIYIILNKGFNYIQNIRSVTYWKEYLNTLRFTHKFIHSKSAILKGISIPVNNDNSDFYPIILQEITMPKIIRGDVYVSCIINNNDTETIYISIDEIEQHKKDFVYEIPQKGSTKVLSEESSEQLLVHPNYSTIDKSNVFEASIRNHANSRKLLKEYGIELDRDDTNLKICIFSAEKPSSNEEIMYQGFVLDIEVILPESCINLTNKIHKTYLLKRGAEGIQSRKEVAKTFNLIISRNYRDSLLNVRIKQK